MIKSIHRQISNNTKPEFLFGLNSILAALYAGNRKFYQLLVDSDGSGTFKRR